MIKVKSTSGFLSNNLPSAPSPDNKSANRIRTTASPSKQIQRYLTQQQQKTISTSTLALGQSFKKNTTIKMKRVQVSQQQQQQQHTLNNNQIFHHPDDLKHIKYLEQQLARYRSYVKQYEGIAERNKKMEKQMQVILRELQDRNQIQEGSGGGGDDRNSNAKGDIIYRDNAAMPNNPKTDNKKTVKKQSNQQRPSQRVLQTLQSPQSPQSPQSSSSSELQIQQQTKNFQLQLEELYEYVTDLENTIQQLTTRNKEVQGEIRKNVSKDVNDMEKRLMNYIFGLEEKLTEVTFRNHQIIKNLDTFRTPQITERMRETEKYHEQGSSSGQQLSSVKKEKDKDKEEEFPQTPSLKNKNGQSQISMMNLQVSNSFHSPTMLTYSKTGREDSIQHIRKHSKTIGGENIKDQTLRKYSTKNDYGYQLGIDSKMCENCLKYIKQIEGLRVECERMKEDCERLREEAWKVREGSSERQGSSSGERPVDEGVLRNVLKKESQSDYFNIPHKDSSGSGEAVLPTFKMIPAQKQVPIEPSTIKIEVEESKISKIPSRSEILASKLNMLQSHIDIIVDTSSIDESFMTQQNPNGQTENQHSFTAEHYLTLEKIKGELINIMQTLQDLVHTCEYEPKGSLLPQIQAKVKIQDNVIRQLEQELSFVKMQLDRTKLENQKLQKFWKARVREEDDIMDQRESSLSPRNNNSSMISCVDPLATKQKIDQILKSIRSFESEYRQYSSP